MERIDCQNLCYIHTQVPWKITHFYRLRTYVCVCVLVCLCVCVSVRRVITLLSFEYCSRDYYFLFHRTKSHMIKIFPKDENHENP